MGVAFSPDGRQVVSGGRDYMLRFWDVATGKETRQIKMPPRYVVHVAFAQDGKTALMGGLVAGLIDLPSEKEIRQISWEKGCMALAFSRDGAMLAGGGLDRTVSLREAASGPSLRCLCSAAA
jgi:WD40 repeat protein